MTKKKVFDTQCNAWLGHTLLLRLCCHLVHVTIYMNLCILSKLDAIPLVSNVALLCTLSSKFDDVANKDIAQHARMLRNVNWDIFIIEEVCQKNVMETCVGGTTL